MIGSILHRNSSTGLNGNNTHRVPKGHRPRKALKRPELESTIEFDTHSARIRVDLREFLRRLTATCARSFQPAGPAARSSNGPCCLGRSASSGVTGERCEQFADAMGAVERVPKRH